MTFLSDHPGRSPRRADVGYSVGDAVDHKFLGRGTVVAVKGDALEIRFEQTGETKKLLVGYAPIARVGHLGHPSDPVIARPAHLGHPSDAVWSLVVFNDDAKFPDLRFLPHGCYVTKLRRVNEAIDKILSEEPVFSDAQVKEIAYELRKHRVPATEEVRAVHIRGIQKAIGRDRVLD